MSQLSIVIPTKNEAVHLPKLLECLKKQTFTDFEVLIADADSIDGTVEIASSFGAKVVKGGLPGIGRNAGAKIAKGEWILFMDADVTLPSERYLEMCLDEIVASEFDVATCKVKPQTTNHIDRAFHEAYNAYAIATEKIRPHAGGFCIFIRRDVHRKISGFDEDVTFAEDHDYVQRAVKSGYRFGILRCCPVIVSVRRLEKDGRLAIALKYMYTEFRSIMKGPFKGDEPFLYSMGGDEEDEEKQL
ncbi:MAG: glycosyltransferase [bacterium]|nr:glycosyltransferase [bacterium]